MLTKSSSTVTPKKIIFFRFFPLVPQGRFWKKNTFFQEWRWRNFLLTFLESTLKIDLEIINLSSVWFGRSCNIGWVTSVFRLSCLYLTKYQPATAPAMTTCWQAVIKLANQSKPKRWYSLIQVQKSPFL